MSRLEDPYALAVPVTERDHFVGPLSATVKVVEYGDFECPSCGQAFPAVKIMLGHFGARVCFAFRHYPVAQLHPHAELAAEASEAAAAQGRFWPLHDLLFGNWLHLTPAHIRKWTKQVGLDTVRYDREMAHRIYLKRVCEDVETGNQSGVRSTPTFFVNGEHVDVTFGTEHLYAAVEAALAR